MLKNILISGYRAHELNIFDQKHAGIAYIKQAIRQKLIPLLEEGLEWVITPGQYGTDLWAIETAIELQEQYSQLRTSVIAAYQNYTKEWKDAKREYAEQLLRSVDYYAAVSHEAYNGPWQFAARDELLLRKTDGIILFYDEELGEASPKYLKDKVVKKQEKEGYKVILLHADDVQSIADDENYAMPD